MTKGLQRLLLDFSCPLENRNLSFVVRVMLDQATNHRSYRLAGAECGITLIADPPHQILWPDRIDRGLQILMGGAQVFRGSAPGSLAPTGAGNGPILGRILDRSAAHA